MSYGSKQWQDWVLDEEEALPLIEHAYKRGINTWDTVGQLTPGPITGKCYFLTPITGRCLLPRALRSRPRQSPEEVQHPAQPRRHLDQVLLRRRRRGQLPSHRGLSSQRRLVRQPRRSIPEAHLRCGGRQRGATGHVHRRPPDPPSGPSDAPRGDHEGFERCCREREGALYRR